MRRLGAKADFAQKESTFERGLIRQGDRQISPKNVEALRLDHCPSRASLSLPNPMISRWPGCTGPVVSFSSCRRMVEILYVSDRVAWSCNHPSQVLLGQGLEWAASM